MFLLLFLFLFLFLFLYCIVFCFLFFVFCLVRSFIRSFAYGFLPFDLFFVTISYSCKLISDKIIEPQTFCFFFFAFYSQRTSSNPKTMRSQTQNYMVFPYIFDKKKRKKTMTAPSIPLFHLPRLVKQRAFWCLSFLLLLLFFFLLLLQTTCRQQRLGII